MVPQSLPIRSLTECTRCGKGLIVAAGSASGRKLQTRNQEKEQHETVEREEVTLLGQTTLEVVFPVTLSGQRAVRRKQPRRMMCARG